MNSIIIQITVLTSIHVFVAKFNTIYVKGKVKEVDLKDLLKVQLFYYFGIPPE